MGFILSVGNGFGGMRGIRVGVNGGVGGPNDVGLALGTCEGEEEICGMDGIEVGVNGGVGAPLQDGSAVGMNGGVGAPLLDGGAVGMNGGVGAPLLDGSAVGMNGGVGGPKDVGMGLGTCEGEEEIGMDGGCVGLSVGSRVGCGGRVGI